MQKRFILLLILLSLFLVSCKKYVHYTDTNGDDNYTLENITDEMIVKQNTVLKIASISNETVKDGNMDMTYSVGRFDGVEKEYTFKRGKYEIEINFTVNSGNARLVISNDKEIVYDFNVNESGQTYILDVNERHYLKLAGEDANISVNIKITKK